MMPDNVFSTVTVPAPMLAPDTWERTSMLDFEEGGIGLNDATQGITGYTWKAWIDTDGNFWVNRIDRSQDEAKYLFRLEGCSQVGLAFDRNMNVAICYQKGSSSFLYWFDTSVSAYVTTEFAGAFSPVLTHDDKRNTSSATSDILMFYLRGTRIYMRMQRDRYLVEYNLAEVPAGYWIDQVGMGTNLRLQLRLVPG